MRARDLHYDLPPELIAQHALEPRDAARLLVVDRATQTLTHRAVRDLPDYLHAGDALVLNNTLVIPARFTCRRATGGMIEALYLHAGADGTWHVLLKRTGRLKPGEALTCVGTDCVLRLVERVERGAWCVRPEPPSTPLELLAKIGQTPLPPYIRRPGTPEPEDAARYQTIYASQPGAVAAPTAGLHFTAALLDRLSALGVRRTEVTLHVGLGTFQPIEVEDLRDHRMHAEWFEVSAAAAEMLHATRAAGGRLIAVGTTAARVLESLPDVAADPPGSQQGWTDIFIYPAPERMHTSPQSAPRAGYPWRNVDALLTNFHLPRSTLLALVMAFAGADFTRRAYAAAVAERYRFYSYGDAMLIV